MRPTTDFSKTGLFNILENRFELTKLTCLDLFSGTGNISLELISRGCKHVTAVDRDKDCISFLKDSAAKLGITNITTVKNDVLTFIDRNTIGYDLIFADPPFESGIHEQLCYGVFKKNMLRPEGVLILEHKSGEDYSHIKGFSFSRKYGNVTFSFFFNLVPSQPL